MTVARVLLLLPALTLAALMLCLPPAVAADAPSPASSAAVISCQQLQKEDFTGLAEAPTAILSATVVAATPAAAEYCDVTGTVQPQVQFELRLPTKTWNGRYFQTGCGGFCGVVPIASCTDALAKDFAVAAQNMGHVGDILKDPV